tara:strand:+ start:2272 stop:2853 length:582 start_codon:yes stop_codon:yes gene_type:complete
MSIVRLKITLDTKGDVSREIEIHENSSLLHLHHAVLDAFGWASGEMASFFESDNNWDKGREISLMGEGDGSGLSNTKIQDILKTPSSKAIYVYDFLRMWCFYVELLSTKEETEEDEYPRLCIEVGTPPPFNSKDGELMEGMGLDNDFDEEGAGKHELTGDPDIDAYLAEQHGGDETESWNDDHDSLDGLDELM